MRFLCRYLVFSFIIIMSSNLEMINFSQSVTLRITATVPTGGLEPRGLSSSSDGSFLYVVNSKSQNLAVLELASLKVQRLIELGFFSIGITTAPNGKFAFVSNTGSTQYASEAASTVTVVDLQTSTLIGRVKVGLGPIDSASSLDGKFIYVPNFWSDEISVIDVAKNQVVTTIRDIKAPLSVVASPDGQLLYVCSNNPRVTPSEPIGVVVIERNTNRAVATIKTDGFARRLAISSDGRHLYVTTQARQRGQGSKVLVIDANTRQIIQSITFGGWAEGIAATSDGRLLLVANGRADNVIVISTNTNRVVATLALPEGSQPRDVVIDRKSQRAFVTNVGSNTVSVIEIIQP